MTSTLRQAKSILRKETKESLKKLTQSEKSLQSDIVVKKALSQHEYKNSSRISIFLPMPDEVNTLPILKKMFEDDKEVFIPHYEGPKMIMVQLKSLEEYNALPTTSWNIKQPLEFDPSQDACLSGGLDLIFMPGLAFTVQGTRLGRGKGYYDTYLQRCTEQVRIKPKTIGLAFHQQIIEDIPLDNHDIIIDKIIFPSSEEMSNCDRTMFMNMYEN